MGRTLLEQGDGIDNPGLTLPGTGSLAITFDDTGTSGLTLDFLVLSGTPSVSIASNGASPHTGFNRLNQLIETDHSLTTVTISGSEPFILGSSTGDSNTGDGVVTDILVMPQSSTTIHSSLNSSMPRRQPAIWRSAQVPQTQTPSPTLRSRIQGSFRAAISSRMTLRTVSLETATPTPTPRSCWAEPVRRPFWAPVSTIMQQ